MSLTKESIMQTFFSQTKNLLSLKTALKLYSERRKMITLTGLRTLETILIVLNGNFVVINKIYGVILQK